jgi:hypothetical protein
MVGDLRGQVVELEHRQTLFDQPGSRQVTERKLCGHLRLNSFSEFSLTLKIKRHDDHSAKETAKESRNPLGTVPGPEQNAIAFGDLSRRQLAGKLECSPANPIVRPPIKSEARSVRERRLMIAS